MRGRQEDFSIEVTATLRDKMAAVADRGLDKLAKALEVECDAKTISDITDKTLARLGYSGKPDASPITGEVVNVQNNNTQINNTYVVDKGMLAGARDRIAAGQSTEQEPSLLGNDNEPASQASLVDSLGTADGLPSPVRSED